MGDLQLVLDLVLAVAVAFVGGTIAHRLGQPVILGYLVAGLLIGPFTPGPVLDPHTVQVLAEIGVALLMFALGAEVSFAELRRMGRIALIGGPLQIVCTTGIGPLLAPTLGLTLAEGVYFGALVSLSSTVVALKVLLERGELGALHGRVALGVLLAQDVAVVPMVVLLPSLVAGGQGLLGELALAAVKAVGVVLGAYLVGVRLVPLALRRAAVSRTRELFVLGVVALALGTAVMTQLAGLSLAFGAFLAGLVVAESEFRTQVIAEVLPLRDLFASIFFVSIGMLIDPRLLLSEAGLIAGVGAIVVLVKFGVVAAIVLLLGMPGRVAVLAGLSLAQVGEFSFVLAGVGVQRGAIPSSVFDLTLALALVTIVLSPSLMRTGPGLLKLLQRAPWLGGRLADPAEPARRSDELRHHAVICGYGRVGRELADALQARGLRFLVIEYNPDVVRRLRDQKIPVVYGDAANPAVLEHAHLEHARLLALLMPDARAAEVATRHARAMNPRLDIVARGGSIEELDRLRQAGATEVVQPEFEAGVEVIRHALHRFGVGGMELASAVSGRRNAYYRRNVESETP